MLGISVLLKESDAVSCGHFEPLTEKIIAVAKFEKAIEGYVKMVGHLTPYFSKFPDCAEFQATFRRSMEHQTGQQGFPRKSIIHCIVGMKRAAAAQRYSIVYLRKL